MIGARFIQGIGAAMQASVILAIIATEFPQPADRARAMSAYVFVAVAGGSLGLLAGGVLTQALSWHWIFFVNLPIGAMTIALGRALIPADQLDGPRARVDWLGSLLVTASLMSAVYAIVQASTHGWGSSSGARLRRRRGRADARLRGRRGADRATRSCRCASCACEVWSARASCAASSSPACTRPSSSGRSIWSTCCTTAPLQTGLAFLPWTLTVAALSLGITARLVERFGAMRVLLTGMLTVIVGLGLLTTVGPHTSFFPTIFLAYFTIGLGIGSAFMPLLTIAMADVPAADAGLGSGIINVSQQVSGALGLAVLGTLATNRTHALEAAHHSLVGSLIGGYHLAFAIGAASVVAGTLAALALLRAPRSREPELAVVESGARRARTSSCPTSSGRPPDFRRLAATH